MSEAVRCVMVTGGSRGLGLATLRDLLEHGYRLAACSRTMGQELESIARQVGGDRLFWRACHLGAEEEEVAFFADALRWAGETGIYGLINNAAVAQDGVLATFPNVDSERIITTNLLSALRMARLMLRHLLTRSGGGRIVNISSIIGLRGYTGLAAYSASKAGLDGMTRALAREVGRRGITVNSVAPGYLDTEMSERLEQRQRQQIINRTPQGRLGTVGDVVPVIRFLLGAEAGFVTGQTIVVDGGASV
jgi:3-oxoacyl-[acyl-carrier protein] reductase